MDIQFLPINIQQNFSTCINFRKDAYLCSFGHLEGSDEFLCGYKARMTARKHESNWHYDHIWLEGNIIGQLEFHSQYLGQCGNFENTGYLNLIYLIPEYRGKGISGMAQQYVENVISTESCNQALLSVSRTNQRAIQHYVRHGWRYYSANLKHETTDFYIKALKS